MRQYTHVKTSLYPVSPVLRPERYSKSSQDLYLVWNSAYVILGQYDETVTCNLQLMAKNREFVAIQLGHASERGKNGYLHNFRHSVSHFELVRTGCTQFIDSSSPDIRDRGDENARKLEIVNESPESILIRIKSVYRCLLNEFFSLQKTNKSH